jgi:TonB family protein
MRTPHHFGVLVLISSLLYHPFLSGSRTAVQAQQPDVSTDQDTSPAIQISQQEDATEAIKRLSAIVEKDPDDVHAWYYLGLAFQSLGFMGNARPAFEQVVRLRPDSADAHARLAFALILADESQKALATAQRALELGDQSFRAHYAIAEASLRTGTPAKALEEAETALRINPNFVAALITKSFAHYGLQQYTEAMASLEQFLASAPDDMDADTWRGQLQELRGQIYQPSSPGTPIFSPKEVMQKARVLQKPEPQYTEAARKAGVTGTVALRATFSANGQVEHILVLKALGYGLTTQAVQAARRVEFNPAMKDGRPVSTYVQFEYNFNLF